MRIARRYTNRLSLSSAKKSKAVNGYANLLRAREVLAGYRGAALMRGVLALRHSVAVQQNIPCPFVGLVFGFAFRFVEPHRVSKGTPLARRWMLGAKRRVNIGVVPVFLRLCLHCHYLRNDARPCNIYGLRC